MDRRSCHSRIGFRDVVRCAAEAVRQGDSESLARSRRRAGRVTVIGKTAGSMHMNVR